MSGMSHLEMQEFAKSLGEHVRRREITNAAFNAVMESARLLRLAGMLEAAALVLHNGKAIRDSAVAKAMEE